MRILHLEEDPSDTELVRQMLHRHDLHAELSRVSTSGEFREALTQGGHALILADYTLRGLDPLAALRLARQIHPEVPFIFVSGTPGEEAAIEALKQGATDYVLKQRLGRLVPAVRRALHEAEERRRRKQAAQALRESEDRLTRTRQFSFVMALNISLEGRWLRVPPAFVQFLGYAGEEELLGRPFKDFTHPDDFQAGWSQCQRLIAGEIQSFEMEKRFIRKDGSITWGCINCSVETDGRGRPVHFLTCVRDINAQKQAETALRVSEQRLEYHVQNSPLAIIEWDAGFRITRWTGAAEHIFGWPAEEVLGKQIQDRPVVHEDDRSGVDQVIARLLSGEEPRNISFNRNYRRDGAIVHCEWYNSALHDEQGRIVSVLSLGLDATERKHAEALLRQSEERYHRFFEDDLTGNFITTPAGQILLCNPAFVRIFGFSSAQEAIGANFLDLYLDPEERSLLLERLQQQGKIERFEVWRRRLDGQPVYIVENLVGNFNERGELYEIKGYLIDDTERKRAEEALRTANEQLAEADRRKDEFLAMLAHELRNPLAPVRNAVQIMSLAGPQEPILQRQRDIIARQVTHMARLLDDLLDVSRITRGKITLKKQTVRLADALARAVETASPLITAHRHIFSIEMESEDELVIGDFDRLIQIVGNLLTNAAKYTEEGGRIWLKAARETGELVIRVRDTGMGIAPDLLPKVFDVFTQAERSLDRAQGGLGLGLNLVRNLTQMHGGRVEAHSAGPGKGSEFIVRLPALPAPEALPVRHHESVA